MTTKQFTFVATMAGCCLLTACQAFVISPRTTVAASSSVTCPVILFEATGGWGIGQSRDISPEEFAKGDRRAFEGYELKDRGDFMLNVKDEAEQMRRAELDELLGVARIAGINVKNPSERLNKFGPDLLDDEDIDLSV